MLKERNFTNYNAPTTLMKVGSIIKINKLDDYNEIDLKKYQQLIDKLIYPTCKIKPDIAFIVKEFSKYNTDFSVDNL